MKFRNKKTGEVFDALIREKGGAGSYSLIVCDVKSYEQSRSTLDATYFVLDEYETLTELNEDWEDYKPAEPLIKDEKIRKAVRAWAELIPSAQVRYDHSDGRFYTHSDYIVPYSISFPVILGLDETTDYTIAELCGEEEDA